MKALDTGLIEFEVPFDTGYVGKLHFNPNDIDFYDNLICLEDNIRKLYTEYENITVTKENNDEIVHKIKNDLCPKIKSEFNKLFGENASEVIFKYASPVAFVKNEYYPYYFLNAFLPDVAEKMNKTNQTVKLNYEKLSKHAIKYIGKKNVGTTKSTNNK